MKKSIIAVAMLGSVALAANAQTFDSIEFSILGADAATIHSVSGQTFTDIGSTLGIDYLQGVDLTLQYVGSVFWANGLQSNGTPNLSFSDELLGISNGTLTATFSENVMVRLGGHSLAAPNVVSFGDPGLGSLVDPGMLDSNLTLTDDSVTNSGPVFANDDYAWDSTSPGSVWTMTHTGSGWSNTRVFTQQLVVPEPSSVLLLSIGALGFALRRKRN